MTVNISLFAGAGAQFFDDNGSPLAGGLIYTYAAGTNTPAITYTTSAGNIQNSNPIVLDAAGRTANEVWLTSSALYKFVLRTSANVLIGTYDDIPGVNDYEFLQNTSTFPPGADFIGFKQGDETGYYANAVASTVYNKLTEIISAKDFGAVGDGLTNNVTPFTNANTIGKGIYVPAGDYTFQSNITFTTPVIMAPGALFTIPNGVTVTFNNNFVANFNQVFDCVGTGNVKFNSNTPIVYAEWWGTFNDNIGDDAIPVQAACNSLTPNGGIVQLLNKKYYFKSLLTITTQCLTLQGTTTGPSPYDFGSGGPWGTQIVGENGENCIRVYNVGYTTINNLEVYIPTGATAACVGITLDSCFLAKVNDCRINNFTTGIRIIVCTNTYIFRCYLASKDTAFTTVIGIDVDGTTTQNQSLSIDQCVAAHSNYTATAYGYYLHGDRINDTFFDNCEASFCTSGYYIDGTGVDAGYGADIHFRGCIADGCVVGFDVNEFGVDSMMEITNGWSACSSIGIFVGYSSARVLISQMQVYGAANGVIIQDSQQCSVVNCTFLYQELNSIFVSSAPLTNILGNQATQKAATSAVFVNVEDNSDYCNISNNIVNATVTGGWAYGIITEAGSSACCVVGNSIPTGAITQPYLLNLGSNTDTYFAGTGIPN